jgi:antagonist of KipI
MITVLSPGLLTIFQDLGRSGYAHAGVSVAGAADPLSFRVANRLVGNPENAPALELTLQGGRYRFEEEAVFSVCGGEFECNVPMWACVPVQSGFVLEVGPARTGCRCYLAVRGGFEAPIVLGSASTHLLSGFGRQILRGDRLEFCSSEPSPAAINRSVSAVTFEKQMRVTPGAESDDFSGTCTLEFLSTPWIVSEQSNRQGIRLSGPPLAHRGSGTMASEGVALGAVQVPASGEPMILFVDSQTTGGYPVIANVIAADIPRLGQLRPRDVVRFEAVSFVEARRLLFEQEAWISNV